MINLDFSGDYTQKISDVIDYLYDEKLVSENGEYLSEELRCDLCDSVIEAYVEQTGERPKSAHLDRMASYINKRYMKLRKGSTLPKPLDYPFLSDRQFKSRRSRELDWSYSNTIDTNGVNRRLPTRLNRISNEVARGDVKLSDKV